MYSVGRPGAEDEGALVPGGRRPGQEEEHRPGLGDRESSLLSDSDRRAAEEEGGDDVSEILPSVTSYQSRASRATYNSQSSSRDTNGSATRHPENTSSFSLAPPRRKISNQGTLLTTPAVGLAAIGEDEEADPMTESFRPPRRVVSKAGAGGGSAYRGPPVTRAQSRAPGSVLSLGGSSYSLGGASTIQGKKTVRLSVIPAAYQSVRKESIDSTRALSFTPKRLLDIENGKSMLVTDERFLPQDRYQELDDSGALVVTARTTMAPIAKEDSDFFEERSTSLRDKMNNGTVIDFTTNNEVGFLGGAWRGTLKRLILHSMDEVNSLRLSRGLQLFLPFQTGYEAYLIGQMIEVLDAGRRKDIKFVLNICFQNRNVSRILTQQMGPRFDFLWHWSTQITWNRVFDIWGQLPIVGITSFPATENFPATRDHALASIFRVLLGQGNWITRVVTQGREGLVTDNPKNTAQNLAAESNGFELANRNQYGTYIGRRKTNEFRFSHRLPTDESIVRTFVTTPMPTIVNNGVVHQIRQLAKHWHNMLFQFSGNFAHQRQEQLDPFETLRFHLPVVLLTLSSLRGRNEWDSSVLGPMVRRLQELKPTYNVEVARLLAREVKEKIAVPVCGGVAAISDPLKSWLDAIYESCGAIEEEARKVYEIATSVEIGIRLGHDLITQVTWQIPSDRELKQAILGYIKGKPNSGVDHEGRIRSAMLLTTPRDKRTLIELVRNGFEKSKPAQLLLGRTKTLLQRELRRGMLNNAIRSLSKGDPVQIKDLRHDEWYWVSNTEREAVYCYDAKVTGKDQYRFIHVDSRLEEFLPLEEDGVEIHSYVPVAEAISRAQKAFMTIELDYGKKFSYNAFMEFTYLRVPLRRLVVLSQVHCEELDNARLNVLAEIQRSNQPQISIHDLMPGETYYTYNSTEKVFEPFVCQKKYTASDPEWDKLARTKIVRVPPQSMIVIGGGPTGLMTTVHCAEAVLASGGVMKLFEARDAFAKGGATFERAQIVRLDSRWIGMLRYHLGTGFEDVYIPASGETDSQLGNTLPTQGFVEITIKDLENMLNVETSKMWSKGLIKVYTDSRSQYDAESNTLTKLGEYLKVDDGILRRVDENGKRCTRYHSWKVAELIYTEALYLKDLTVGMECVIYINHENAVFPFKLTAVDIDADLFRFKSLTEGIEDLMVSSANLPSVYPKGTKKHGAVEKVIIESLKKGAEGGYVRDELKMSAIKKEKFTMDIGHTHVVEAIGKPHGSKVHFSVTTYEPYGVCCIQGLKVSMGMHNFGEKRWGAGLLDDIRSQNDQNTRIVGDFTKMVRSEPIARKMFEFVTDKRDKNWQKHFEELVRKSDYPELNDGDPIADKIAAACQNLAESAKTFKRQTLQTRFFETGDNYYLGMEFGREYDAWKNRLADDLVASLMLKAKDDTARKAVGKFRGVLMHHIDRLWYDGCLETIRIGDVYNPGARGRIPRLYLINSYTDAKLGSLPVGESFRLSSDPKEKYEIVIKKLGQVVVRDVEGNIKKMKKSTLVKREGNLTRSPDGNAESRVSLATFPVGHYVNHRTMRLNDSEKGYVFAFIGDEQATPHFMRYSGLTGACINAMLFNNFIKQAIDGIPFIDRFKLYSVETNWSNGEVVQRGTGANYGEDGFLRPGFSYSHGIDYLYSKVVEYRESDQDSNNILSRDWKVKFAASMIPRGMELNSRFVRSMYRHFHRAVFDKVLTEAKKDKSLSSGVGGSMESRYKAVEIERESGDSDAFWDSYLSELDVDQEDKRKLSDTQIYIARRLDRMCREIVESAHKAYLYNERVSSELYNQPKPVDSIVDDFAVEAQNFANSLAMSAAFSSGALAFTLVGSGVGDIFSGIVAFLNILLSFGTMTNVSRYKLRNEEARIIFQDEKMVHCLKAVFAVMDQPTRASYRDDMNPFAEDLNKHVAKFLKSLKYYDFEEPTEFLDAFDTLKANINDPKAIRAFQEQLSSDFIADKYQVSSYVQEYLVNIYRSCEEMHYLLTQSVQRTADGSGEARSLFDRLQRFRDKLEGTLQRGPVRFGFLKKRNIMQWDCSATLQYFYSLACCSSRSRTIPASTISNETLGIARQARHLSSLHQSQILRREIRDFDTLHWATRESYIGSLMFMAGFSVFIVSIVFTIARIASIRELLNFAFWASLASAFGAILATFHFFRKLLLLLKLQSILGFKVRAAKSTDDSESIAMVRAITWTQIVFTFMRLLAAVAAAVALPWNVAERGYGDKISLHKDIPFLIALGAVCIAVGATVLFLVVEYIVRYNLPPKLGEFVCEAFREEIETMFKVLLLPSNEIETKQVQERETWEYVAREFLHRYRFDAVFAADRFGSILQYIQGGMDPRM